MRRLCGEALEARFTPALVWSAGGSLGWDGAFVRTPFPDAKSPLALSVAIDAHSVFVGAGVGGGPAVVEYDRASGAEVSRRFAYEDTFRGGVNVATDGNEVYVGSGPGGGPRIVELRSGRTYFVGDPSARTGVDVAGWGDPTVPAHTSPLRAEGDPERPAAPAAIAAVQSVVDTLPDRYAAALARLGDRLYVYAGTAVTDLPRFAPLRGVQTGAGGDGSRTYDQVAAVGGAGGAVVPAGVSASVVLHELGHGYEAKLPAAIVAEWDKAHGSVVWPTPYEAANPGEAFAESVRRWNVGIPQPALWIDTFLDNTLEALS